MAGGHVRVNAAPVSKPAQAVGPGDVLTFAQGRRVRVVRIAAIASRRGPAVEARTLYEDLTPPDRTSAPRAGARPTKKDRRDLDALRDRGE